MLYRNLFSVALLPVAMIATVHHSCIANDNVDDGIYTVSQNETALKVSDDNGDIFLDKLISGSLGNVSLQPDNNENSNFTLTLLFDARSRIDMDRPYVHAAVIVIDENAYQIQSSGGDGSGKNRRLMLTSSIDSREVCERIAKHLKIEVPLREHPGHVLLVNFRPTKETYSKNEPVLIEMTIKNTGDKAIEFFDGGYYDSKRNNQFSFVCEFDSRVVNDIGDSHEFGGLASYAKLKPGEDLSKKLDLRNWFAMDQTGSYSVNGKFMMALVETGNTKLSHQTIWDDQVTGDFKVIID